MEEIERIVRTVVGPARGRALRRVRTRDARPTRGPLSAGDLAAAIAGTGRSLVAPGEVRCSAFTFGDPPAQSGPLRAYLRAVADGGGGSSGRTALVVALVAGLFGALLLAMPSLVIWRLAATGDGDDDGARGGPGRLAGGTTHSCALAPAGTLKCWGGNADFQLGTGFRTWSRVPLEVVRLGTSVVEVAVGGSHSCARTDARGVWCWSKQGVTLGVGDRELETAAPIAVPGLGDGVQTISAGNDHTCAITAAGGVRCWGEFHGADLKPVRYLKSRPVLGLDGGVVALSAGYDDGCAATATGTVRCWGEHYTTRAGTSPLTSVAVAGVTSATAVAVGGTHACALSNTGTVTCWGGNRHGQLGNGTTTDSTQPVAVSGLADVVAISAGYQYTCALTGKSTVACWGHDEYGQLGSAEVADTTTPVGVAGLTDVAALSAGFQHACAMTGAGVVKCWGHNFEGQLGIGPTTLSNSPTPLGVVGL